ncbi:MULTISPECIES: fumarylacetoacetate hydrolase family protein [unclassified Janthinobacterium]|uniref:fumarylacetoacetate hydrolase family protein n=1 Tax=unclassified Janthinobacterium TaxID=2610881 RepID=UPI001619D611|nr:MULTISPECIES: fumarylacetoacetate hydrolase family protein [unclassified Janthinobacterium]MBB5370651.1 2-keto-4-pentenoate hydratase/2-oxohepta-3-ene-1,7-dioic acid hydratase in catechol pathway [Janthinobacterium sp. K2C7]MBB5383457.1 2-keto-4-pentenoate hydratase/2-oxohepta-3-ene-1,7-dioic acid hydratase in catechol pathway [Janthinobacterium sp. K2Li3]MBB5388911.1 2-keto-4-pentenoate hydratase/2-oxohepta-3-ene-1,7-dioic acid hydratase in catechol pathway [Janthinobacterium sp. K2E3]
MKFATFIHAGVEQVGVVDLDAGRVHPLAARDMLAAIALYPADGSAASDNCAGIALGDVQLLAPLPRPERNIFCVGKNYRAHAQEFSRSGYEAGAVAGAEIDAYPAVFTKPGSSVVGPEAVVDLHAGITSEVDYEGELAVIIGKPGRNIAVSDAMAHVWGYTIINDVTARDRQKNHRQWLLGKGLDTFCPMGPWIVTADELQADQLRVQTWVNGELRQDGHTADLLFSIPELVSTISAGMALKPGDVISTGTPAGVGIGMVPPRFLQPGDSVSVVIDGIGTLRNRFA